LFNILQEGDVQIKGYPVRLALDVVLVFSANPEDYTARGKIITPLKDRIGSEIRTHYPRTRQEALAITAQEAWTVDRGKQIGALAVDVPPFVSEIVEEIAFHARRDQHVDRRSGVSQRLSITTLENVVSNAERRALVQGESSVVPRVSDIFASLPAVTGKLELEYEGELKGADVVAREVIRQAVAAVFDGHAQAMDSTPILDWFNDGGVLDLSDTTSAEALVEATERISGMTPAARAPGSSDRAPIAWRAATYDFVLEGLCALKRLTRTDDGRMLGTAPAAKTRPAPDRRFEEMLEEDDEPKSKGRKKYYN
jgi:magnesium chelatase subunit I